MILAMKITSVRSFLMSYPLAEPLKLRFLGGERTIVKVDPASYRPTPWSDGFRTTHHGLLKNLPAYA